MRAEFENEFAMKQGKFTSELEQASESEMAMFKEQMAQELSTLKQRDQAEFDSQVEAIGQKQKAEFGQLEVERASDAQEIEERVTSTLQAQFLQEFHQLQEKQLAEHGQEVNSLKAQLEEAQHEALQQSKVMLE